MCVLVDGQQLSTTVYANMLGVDIEEQQDILPWSNKVGLPTFQG